jgi:hypothetical protein
VRLSASRPASRTRGARCGYSEDSGTPQDAANLVQEFLARFRSEDTLGFKWANTCSRPLVDAFGGDAVFITATSSDG